MAEVLKKNNMKKESSFKLRSGNDIGRSVTKLMKEAPLKDLTNLPAGKDELTGKPSNLPAIASEANLTISQLEDKVKGFFGNIASKVNEAQDKNKKASKKRSDKISTMGKNIEKRKKEFESKAKKAGRNIKNKLEAFRERFKIKSR